MTSRGDEDEQEDKGEKDTLIDKGISIEIQSAKDDDTFTAEDPPPIMVGPNVCERLIRARKSLTRCQPVFETFDYPLESEKPTEKEPENKLNSTSPDDVDKSEKVSLHSKEGEKDPLSPSGTNHDQYDETEEEEEEEEDDERGPLDNLSASLSAIRMEKFALEKRRVSRVLPRCLHRTFVDPDVEQLFQVYHERQRRADLPLLLINGILLAIYSCILLSIEGVSSSEHLSMALFASSAVLYILFLGILQLKKFPEFGWSIAPYLIWLLCTAELLLLEVCNPYTEAPRQAFLWLLLLTFLCLAALPLRLLRAFILSLITAFLYFLASGFVKREDLFTVQMIGGMILVAASILMGLMSYFFADKKHRRAFLETRQSLEVKMIIEEQSKEQERLLLSVLPKHVADTMRQEMGRGGHGQFKKIYMSRHENVSILFADIVGFTAISSTYTASDLVKMLNELFARFDGLADKYQQLRIKILGDCYYCISGAPKERPDHAVLCVHMGLSMIESIKYVRETTGCKVDMRVGIHTGAVLAGVLGQRQWQFDVYSKDVVLANKMESSGKPGRVHVSNTTEQFLGENFEVEQAFGEKREDALRAASLKTYFISKVLIPHKPRPSLAMIKNGAQNNSSSQPSKEIPSDNTMVSRDSITLSTQDENKARGVTLEKGNASFTSKLQRELVSRDGRKDLLNKITAFSLNFQDADTEASYRRHRETFSGAATTTLPLVVLFLAIARVTLLSGDGRALLVFLLGFALVLCLTSVPAARSFPLPICLNLLKLSDWVHESQFRRSFWFSILLSLSFATVMIDMYLCTHSICPYLPSQEELWISPNQTENATDKNPVFVLSTKNSFTLEFQDNSVTNNATHSHDFYHYNECPLPYYYSYFTLLVLLGASLLAQMNYILKTTMLIIIAALQCFFNVTMIAPTLQHILNAAERDVVIKISEGVLLSIELCLIAILLVLLNRQTEKTSRLLYLWRREVEDQREHAEEIRQRNELLVYNILPPHVATHFMGMRRKKHEELYSQSYEEVGVLFASMPNFSDFYSEESVNNQGLECLRFLNEVISDFDGLLEKPQFCDVIKIKTTGSTYMAASGLNPSRLIKGDDPAKVRWAHLALLVDFAFELVRALQSINEQSFNHFLLRMGINHGPITAGVIGARKPHYDIWGNTVNVASRMESTGKAGCIQVTEATCNILHHFGYIFEQRGLIVVKGKGELMTYYLVGKAASPHQVNGDSSDHIQAHNSATDT